MDEGVKTDNINNAAQSWSWITSLSLVIVAISYIFFLFKSGNIIGEINWLNAQIGFIGVLVMQLSADIFNENHNKANKMLNYAVILLVASILIGLYLMLNTGWPLLIFLLIGVITVIFYRKFKAIGLGELLIYVCYAMAIPMSTAFVITEKILWKMLLIGAPVGLHVLAILQAANTHSLYRDKSAGILTQATRLGLDGSQIVYQTFILAAYLLIAVLVTIDLLHPISFLALISFPWANRNIKKMKSATERDLSCIATLDGDTAKVTLMFSLLLSIANIIAPYI